MSGSEISDGVWQFRLPLRYNPLGYTFSYYIVKIHTLVDAGEESDEARNALKRQMEESGHRITDVERVVLTHLHRDHIGLADFVKSVSGAKICAHEITGNVAGIEQNWRTLYESIREETRSFGGSDFLGLLSRFEGSLSRAVRTVDIDTFYEDGDPISSDESSITVIWTPGHAPEHICLLDADRRTIYSGDHVLPVITPHVSLHAYDEGDPLRDYMESLEKLERVEAEKVYPAHEFAFEGLKSRLTELRTHHNSRASEIVSIIGTGERTVFQVASKIKWKSRPWSLMPFWVKRMAAAETYAHLVFLRNRGRIREKVIYGILFYGNI